MWVVAPPPFTDARVNVLGHTVGDPVALPVRGTDLAVGMDGIWVVGAVDDAVVVIDPADGTVLHRIDGFAEPLMLSIVDDAIWVGDTIAVHRSDQTTGEIVSTVEGGEGRSGAVAAGVWFRRDAEVGHIDADSHSITDAFTLEPEGPSTGDMLVAFGALWTTASEDGQFC